MESKSTIKTLEAELKLLRWHKLANESSLKAAILKDKQMKRSDNAPLLMDDSRMRLAAVIEDERSKDLITDEAFVKKQLEYERKNDEAARRHTLLQAKRLRDIQTKADNIRLSRARRQKCMQIEADPTRCSAECVGSSEEQSCVEKIAASDRSCQALVNFDKPRCQELARGLPCPKGTMESRLHELSAAAVGERRTTKLNFTKLQSRSGPGEPSRPYYCVKVSQQESRQHLKKENSDSFDYA